HVKHAFVEVANLSVRLVGHQCLVHGYTFSVKSYNQLAVRSDGKNHQVSIGKGPAFHDFVIGEVIAPYQSGVYIRVVIAGNCWVDSAHLTAGRLFFWSLLILVTP